MSPHPTALLGLVLILGQTIHMQDGFEPRPSIRVEPGPVVARGRPVTIVCRGPDGAQLFRLQNLPWYEDQHKVSQLVPQGTEARFHIPAVSEGTAGPYHCTYRRAPSWSAFSEPLKLVVTDEDASTLPSGTTGVVSSAPLTHTEHPSSAGDTQTDSHNTDNHGLSPQYVYILIGVSVVFLLCLLLLIFLLVYHQHQKKHGPQSSKDKEQCPQERLSPAVDIIEKTPDVGTVDKIPEKDEEIHTPSPAAGDPQEVTYAQLDHRALTLRAAHTVSPQSTEPAADLNTYAAIARR